MCKDIMEMDKLDRPREKMTRYGPGKLTDAELLAILLRTGTKERGVLDLAGDILRDFKRDKISTICLADLKAHKGVGPVKACEIVAAFELGRRCLTGKKTSVYLKPSDVWDELKDIRDNKKEHFVTFYLDTRNQEIKRDIVSIGTLNYNLVHPREVFEPAVKNLAASIILAHNHPSGCLEPSDEDLSLNKRLIQAGKLLGIEVLDHVIVTRDAFSSFKQRNLM